MDGGHGPGEELNRRALVADLMSDQAVVSEPVTSVILLGQLCRAAALHFTAVGAAVGLMSESGSEGVVASANESSVLLEEVQFTLGEGPAHDAFTTRRPVLIADVGSTDGQAWPVFSASVMELGVTGVFAFPLHIGAAAFGVLTLYTTEPLARDQLAMALTIAEMATEILLAGDESSADGASHPVAEAALGQRVEIYQAQGVVGARLGINLAESLVRMRAHAFSHGHTLAELAALILSGDIDLTEPKDD